MTTATRLALCGCLVLGSAEERSANAQDAVRSVRSAGAATEESTAETERVMVTGSYIPVVPTAAEVGPNPVLVIDRYTVD
jgi:hypothetical protein